uniref:Uncharacterized protein n=1 Tax=Peronospora matthiolae TaxID=2874970 RepID=A0AAV1TM72_9STRA
MATHDVTYVKLHDASSRATIALYAGIPTLELQLLVSAALNHYDRACTGFHVPAQASSSRRPERSPHVLSRLVPLSVASRAPEQLVGPVSALFAPVPAVSQAFATSDTTWLHSEKSDETDSKVDHISTKAAAIATQVGRNGSTKSDGMTQPAKQMATSQPSSRTKWTKEREIATRTPDRAFVGVHNEEDAVDQPQSSCKSIVQALHTLQMLTSLELDIIEALVDQDDSQVLQVLRVYEQSADRDVTGLRDALVSIVEDITMELGDEEKAAAAFARGLGDAVREESEWADSEDNNDDSLGWQHHLYFLLRQWQVEQHLTLADVSTLQNMVNQRHNLLESAYEVFAGDGDASELLDTLQRVAKLQRLIEQSQVGQNGVAGAPLSSLVSLEDVVQEMQRRGLVKNGDAAGLLVLFHSGNEALRAANEAFQADGDVHELEDTLLLVVKHARSGCEEEETSSAAEVQATCRILADLGRSGLLELWQIQLSMSLLKCRDPRFFAAIDVYHEDQDTNELVDTLRILVELVAWERHRRVLVHDWIRPLAQSGMLPHSGVELLVQMVKARDGRIVAALVHFLSDNNKEEFVDTLVQIASLETTKLFNSADGLPEEEHLLLKLAGEVVDQESGLLSDMICKEDEEQLRSREPQLSDVMHVNVATRDVEKLADIERQVAADAADQMEYGDAKEEAELTEMPFVETAVTSFGAEPAANDRQVNEETSGSDATRAESNAQGTEGDQIDAFVEAATQDDHDFYAAAERCQMEQIEGTPVQKENMQEDVDVDEVGAKSHDVEEVDVSPDVQEQ